jgi:hypothetical protein
MTAGWPGAGVGNPILTGSVPTGTVITMVVLWTSSEHPASRTAINIPTNRDFITFAFIDPLSGNPGLQTGEEAETSPFKTLKTLTTGAKLSS